MNSYHLVCRGKALWTTRFPSYVSADAEDLSAMFGHFDRKDNVFPVKDEHQRGNNMTDGAIALIMAFGRAMVGGGEYHSVYEERGIFFL